MSKTVTVPDDWCETCRGTGTQALHGIAITSDEYSTWSEDMVADYFGGAYDTACDMCGGSGRIDPDEALSRHEDEAMLRMESPHLFA